MFSLNISPIKNFFSFKFIFLNMITVRFRLSRSFNTMARRKQVSVQTVPPVPFKHAAMVEGTKTEFGLPFVLTDKRQKYMNFGLSPREKLAKFIRLLGSKSVTASPGRRFTLILSVQKDAKLRYWDRDPSMEVLNGSMFLNHFSKLEWLQRLGLKTSTLTLGKLLVALLGVRTILSTCVMLRAAPVTISFEIIVWSGFKLSRERLFRERLSRDVSQTLVTRSCPMTTGSEETGIWLIDNF